MMGVKRLAIAVPAVSAAVLTSMAILHAEGPRKAHARLSGYQENLTLSTPAHGTLDLALAENGQSLDYKLIYDGIATPVLFAHIHLGRPAINGGIMVFLCTNGTPPVGAPVPPKCPQVGGTVTGTLTAADVIGPTGQGIAPGEFNEFIAALRAQAAYGNVHSQTFPGGEIRGAIGFGGNDDGEDRDDD